MPVLGCDAGGEGEGEEAVDCGDDGAAGRDGEGAVLGGGVSDGMGRWERLRRDVRVDRSLLGGLRSRERGRKVPSREMRA